MPAANHEAEPLLTAYHFNYTHRPRRDKGWALAYWLLLLLTLGWALVSLASRPELLSLLASPAYLDDPAHCPLGLAAEGPLPRGTQPAAGAPATTLLNSGRPLWVASADATSDAAGTQQQAQAHSRRRLLTFSGLSYSLTHAGAVTREALWPAAARAPLHRHHLPSASASSASNATAGAPTPASTTTTAATAMRSNDTEYDYGDIAVLDPDSDSGSGSGSGGLFPWGRRLLGAGGLLLLASLAAAGCVAGLFLGALRHSPWALVLLAAAMQVGAPLVSAFLASKAGHSSLALLLALFSAGLAVSLYAGRASLRLAARLLALAEAALRCNTPLVALCAALQFCLAGAVSTLLAAAAVVGSTGPLLPNPLRAGNAACATPAGVPVTCCALAPSPALPVYLPAAALCLAWTLLLLFEIKVYVVSGVVAQWYFAPAGHLAGGAYCPGGAAAHAADGGAHSGAHSVSVSGYSCGRSLLASLGHALGPSFGSLCCASAVLGVTAYPRALFRLVTRLRRGSLGPLPPAPPPPPGAPGAGPCPPCCAPGPCGPCGGPCCWLPCCVPCWACYGCLGLAGCCAVLLEQLTKFGTVLMATCGEGFWGASAEAVSLLRRNLMDAYNMWWYLPMILHSGAAAFAAAWGYAAFWLASASELWAPLTGIPPLSPAAAGALGGLAAGSAVLVLSFLVSVLTGVADALFICFVLDRDSAAVTWHELHATVAELPCCAAARAAAAEGQYVASYGGGEYGGGGAPPPSYYYMPVPAYGADGSVGGAGAPPYAAAYGMHYQRVLPLPPPPPPAYGYTTGLLPPPPPMPALGHPVGYGNQRPQYGGGGYGGGGGGGGQGFWGWLRSPGGSSGGLYGMPVAGGGRHRNDRPQHPPPAVLSPPYSDQRFSVRPRTGSLPPPPPPPFFGSPVRPS